MKKHILTLFIIVMSNTVKSQKNYNKMDTIYKQDLGSFYISLTRDDSKDIAQWETLLTDKKTGKIQSLKTDSYRKSLRWEYEKAIGEGAFYLYNIINTYYDDTYLYIFYSAWGKIIFNVFKFTEIYEFTTKSYVMDNFFCIGAYGNLISKAEFKKHKNKVYFRVTSGQQYGESAEVIGYQIGFNTYRIYFSNENVRKIHDIEGDTNLNIAESNKESSTKHLKKLLLENGLIKNNMNISYQFSFKDTNISYIFYLEDYAHNIKIVRYNHINKEWIISDYQTYMIVNDENQNKWRND